MLPVWVTQHAASAIELLLVLVTVVTAMISALLVPGPR